VNEGGIPVVFPVLRFGGGQEESISTKFVRGPGSCHWWKFMESIRVARNS